MNKKPIKEIGSVTDVETDELLVKFHKSGNPVEQAILFKKLLEQGNTQMDIAKMLNINQAHVSRHLKLFNLTDVLFEKVRFGQIKARTAYELARRLPKELQTQFESMEKVTMDVVKKAIRSHVVNEDVISALVSPIEVPAPKLPFKLYRCEYFVQGKTFVRHALVIARTELEAKGFLKTERQAIITRVITELTELTNLSTGIIWEQY